MDTLDPTRNFIIFLRGDDLDDALHVDTYAQDETAVRNSWRELGERVGAGEITGIFALWKPSAIDEVFIRDTFADIEVRHQFDRPRAGNWEAAFAHAREVLEAQQAEAELPRRGEELPVLRSASLPDSATIKELMPWVPVVGDHIYATLAQVGPTPHGTIGMHHLLRNQLAGPDEFPRRMADAVHAVRTGLRFERSDSEHGPFTRISRQDGINAAAAIMLPDFPAWIEKMTGGWTDLAVCIPSPDFALIEQTGSFRARRMEQEIRESGPVAELLPSLLRITADGIELIAEGRLR
ncbi:hypothetical protein FPZ12_001455 [Amycolatopsis acidicola]|uniref:Uncharacterized protein n=1 Tax=Amycolatopsis acidicola TaxID=2596893 RepID=A0A5N0VKH0_9PSEU|nr:hypothetical protein [Amycolatopsis acidicola]KAA9166887.1 hypothetical protein FPZ12_001455 [Amycolatopsis acidicola]